MLHSLGHRRLSLNGISSSTERTCSSDTEPPRIDQTTGPHRHSSGGSWCSGGFKLTRTQKHINEHTRVCFTAGRQSHITTDQNCCEGLLAGVWGRGSLWGCNRGVSECIWECVCVCASVYVRYKSTGPRLAINNLRLNQQWDLNWMIHIGYYSQLC